MDNFLSRLNRNPYQPIDGASVTKFDELGNGLDDWGNVIAPRFEAPQQTWGETALGVATAPARLATALVGSLSPYGADGWQVPPIVNEGVNALTAVGDAYNYGMSEDEINSRALGMAGFMMGGGGIAAGRGGMVAANASKEGAVPAIASALSADQGVAGTGTSQALRLGEGSASPNLPHVGQMADGLRGRSLSQIDQQGQAGQNLTMSDQSIGALKGPPIGSFLDKNYYPGYGLNPIHTVNDWSKVRSMARKAIKGEHVPGYLYDGLPNNGNLLAGTHRSAANELLEKLGYNQRIDKANIKDVLDDPSYYGLTPDDAMSLREAVDGSAYDIIDDIWDQTRDTSVFSNSDSRPALLASALDMSPEARLARAREMGFDTSRTLYHGTDRDFESFNPSQSGAYGPGVYVTPDADYANRYAIGRSGWEQDTRIMPLHVRGDMADGMLYESLKREARASGVPDDQIAMAVQQQLQDMGYAGVEGRANQAVTVFDPRNIRSVNAAFDPAKSDSANLLAANADSKPALLAGALGQEQKGITAYHGSPHDFDKFDLSKIGTGEGAQAYGHGLYFAENEGVAKSYRNHLGKSQLDGLPDDEIYDVREGLKWVTSGRSGRVSSNARLWVDDAKSQLEAEGITNPTDEQIAGRLDEQLRPNGRMYQVRINADPNDFLDWDKPLNQQSEKVRNALALELDKLKADYAPINSMDPLEMRASEFYRGIADDHVSASAKLGELGIPGIKYLDAYSRGDVGTVSRNYVLNDDSLIEILKKYGWLVPGAGYGENALSQGQENQY